MLPKAVIVIVALAGLGFFLLKDKLPQTIPQSSQPTKSEESKPLTAEEVLAFGGTCFTKFFEDQSDYLESQKDSSPDIVKVTDKPKFDTQKVSLGVKDDQLVFQFDFKDAPNIDKHHVVRFWIYHDVGNPKDEDRIEVQWVPGEEKWTGNFNAAETFGTKPQQFDPKVQVSNTAVRFEVPKDLLTKDGKIEKINFTTLVVDKQEQTTYADRIWASEGGPSSKFTCSK